MRKTTNDLPRFSPSPWTKWENRAQIEGVELPGVYVLARFKADAPKKVDPTDPAVVYIGETCDQNVLARLYQFGRSAFEEKAGHSGGWTFRAKKVAPAARGLWVAAMGVKAKKAEGPAIIRLIERLLIWGYVNRHGEMPCCNRK
jgi:hypothetical protein